MKPNRNIKIPHRIFLFALSLFFCVCAALILIDYFFFALLWCHFFVTLFLGGGCKGKCKLQTNWLISSQIDFNSSLKCSQFLSVKVFQKCVNARRASAVGGCSLKWKLKKKGGYFCWANAGVQKRCQQHTGCKLHLFYRLDLDWIRLVGPGCVCASGSMSRPTQYIQVAMCLFARWES